MEWYYSEKNERRGPVGEPELNELIRTGRITATTPVWRSGWENWAPLGEAANRITAESGTANCVECHQVFPTSEMVQYEGRWICPNCKTLFFQKVKEGIEPAREMDYAGFWIRFVAKFIDGIIVGVPGYILQYGAMAVFRNTSDQSLMLAGMFLGWILSFSLQIGYAVWLNGKFGATVGKMACGLRIVTPNGGSIGYGLACGRFFAEILSAIILYVGYIMAGFDEEKRALHDRICNTRVVRSRA